MSARPADPASFATTPLETAVRHLDRLVHEFELAPESAARERVFELIECVDFIHREGLKRVADLLDLAGFRQRALDVPEVRLLFELYELAGTTVPWEPTRPAEPGGSFVPLADLLDQRGSSGG